MEEAGFRVQAKAGQVSRARSRRPARRPAVHPEVLFIQPSQYIRASAAPLPFLPLWPLAQCLGFASPDSITGAGVLVGFVDTGVDIFHQEFRTSTGGTRIKWLLDFSDPGDTDGDGELDGSGPFGGTLYSQAQIDGNGTAIAGLDDTAAAGSLSVRTEPQEGCTRGGSAPRAPGIDR